MPFWLTVIGLTLNTVGGVVLYVYGVEPLSVTPGGEGKISFVNTPPEGERERNLALYRRHRCRSRLGLLMLVAGFAAQLVAVLWPRL